MLRDARGRAGDSIAHPRVTLTQAVVISLQLAGTQRNWIKFPGKFGMKLSSATNQRSNHKGNPGGSTRWVGREETRTLHDSSQALPGFGETSLPRKDTIVDMQPPEQHLDVSGDAKVCPRQDRHPTPSLAAWRQNPIPRLKSPLQHICVILLLGQI